MRYLIIEDEPKAAEKLQYIISHLRPNWQCVSVVASLDDLNSKWHQLIFDLAFVDIHLADGLSFSFFEKIENTVPLIFTTAYDQYALKAFELNSLDYLLKPISKENMERALNKVAQWQKPAVPVNWSQLIADYQPNYKERFMVSTGERVISISDRDIAFFFAQGKYCFITDNKGRQFLYDVALSQIIQKLNPSCFFQINRNFIVNIAYIKEMIPYSKARLKVVMNPNTPEDAIVSVERSGKFKTWIDS